MKNIASLFLIGSLFWVACSDDEISYPRTYSNGELVPLGEICVYTYKGKQIIGPEAQEYIHQEYSSSYDPDAPRKGAFRDLEVAYCPTIRFERPDSVVIVGEVSSVGYTLIRQSGMLVGTVPTQFTFASEYLYPMGLYKPELFNNFSYGKKCHPYIVLSGDSANPRIRLYAVKMTSWNLYGDLQRLLTGSDFNKFDPSFLETLTRSDTLAVRQYEIRYRR